jgi:hypothetical protein
LLYSGAALIAASFIIPNGEIVSGGTCIGGLCDTEYQNDNLKTGIFIAGGVAALSSVPFFISSKKNRRKATSVGLNMGRRCSFRIKVFFPDHFQRCA